MKKKILNSIKAAIVVLALIFSFIACDKDFASIGVDVIGVDNFETDMMAYPVITFNNRVKPVQTNNLNSNLLGIYNDNLFGTTAANLVTQMSLSSASLNRGYGVNIKLDSVVLAIPYFSTIDPDEPTNEAGGNNYVLDSIYGNRGAAMKLSIFQNNYFLRDFDPDSNFEDNQKYYSNGETSEGVMIAESELESELIYSDTLNIDNKEIVLTTNNFEDPTEEEEVTSRLKPSLRIQLDTLYWREVIIDKIGELELSNANNFKEYFRGLFFKVENLTADSSMFLLDITSTTSNLTIYFKSVNEFDDQDEDGIPDTVDVDINNDGTNDNGTDSDSDGINDSSDVDQTGGVDSNSDGIDDEALNVNENTIVMNFNGNRVNIFDNTGLNASILSEIDNANNVVGDEKLYLKGGEGSMAVIDLFGGVNSPEYLEFMSHQDEWIINEANLIFYEDEIVTDEDHKNDRLFLYDLENNTPVIDFFKDTPSTTDPFNSVINHLGKRYTDSEGNKKFKIRITEHISNILLNDSTNTKLGLTLSSNVNFFDSSDLIGENESEIVKEIPSGTVLSPKGTVLHGNNSALTNKRVKLEVYYTEPNY
ncbi:MAG: DUF4270 domain-containing protein [Bacteroidia bacterium]|nr:DUF4270 domain-containing protein [Bacteroidia bacterium]